MIRVGTRRPARPWVVLVAVLAVAALLGGCGSASDPSSDGGGEPSASSSPSASASASPSATASATPSSTASSSAQPATLPRCRRVWVEGRTLPVRYVGCTVGGVRDTSEQRYRCESGQVLVAHADRFYAVRGGRVLEPGDLRRDRGFQGAKRRCTA